MKRMKARNIGADEDASEGIWYYLWTRHGWEIHIVKEARSHWTEWSEKIAPYLIKEWRIRSEAKREAIESLQHSLPRGRVDYIGDFYIISHGNDFPSGTDQKSEIGKIISALGLTTRLIVGQVTDKFEQHETMSAMDQQKLQKIIGKVPY